MMGLKVNNQKTIFFTIINFNKNKKTIFLFIYFYLLIFLSIIKNFNSRQKNYFSFIIILQFLNLFYYIN